MNRDSPHVGILISAHSNGLQIRQSYQLGESNESLFHLCITQLASVDGNRRVIDMDMTKSGLRQISIIVTKKALRTNRARYLTEGFSKSRHIEKWGVGALPSVDVWENGVETASDSR